MRLLSLQQISRSSGGELAAQQQQVAGPTPGGSTFCERARGSGPAKQKLLTRARDGDGMKMETCEPD
jgi:hypothetical protein